MFNVLDLVIIGVILLSAILAAWRGFTREVLSIGAWVGAAVIMFLAGPKAVPLVQQYVEKEIIAMIAAYAAVFVIALIPLAYISYRISEGVRGSAIGPVDRLLGFAFGGARGLVIVGVGYLVFTSLVGEKKQPEWFAEARLHPLMAGSGNVIAQLLPVRPDPKVGEKPDEDEPASSAKDDPIIGGKKPVPAKAPAPRPAPAEEEPAAESEPAEAAAPRPKPPQPKERTAREPEAKVQPKERAPSEAQVRPQPKDTAAKARESAKIPAREDGKGYGEREREALDQLIGSATASPSGAAGTDQGGDDH